MRLDLTLVRAVITVLWFALFLAIAASAWSRRERAKFEAAARLPLEDGVGAEESP